MLKTYRVVNSTLLESLLSQVENLDAVERSTEWEGRVTLGVGSFGRKASTKRSNGVQANMHRQIEGAVEALREHGQLREYRPERTREVYKHGMLVDRPYVREVNVVATPVYIPVPEPLQGVRGSMLTVWVCEPIGEVGFIDAEADGSWAWDWVGTYVFLVEEIRDSGLQHFMSGISALCALVNFVAGHDPCGRPEQIHSCVSAHGEPWGRDLAMHPVEKLSKVGGIAGRKRAIETVYKIVQMTDEQASVVNGKEVRLNDILAYPLYIAE
ncbi:hypothetical protein [Streptosporangium saharense]|uniref:hypothetical protein n=1 Tax=Streptosporangium saharense TaxID=1706840 RepID=UPI00331DC78A